MKFYYFLYFGEFLLNWHFKGLINQTFSVNQIIKSKSHIKHKFFLLFKEEPKSTHGSGSNWKLSKSMENWTLLSWNIHWNVTQILEKSIFTRVDVLPQNAHVLHIICRYNEFTLEGCPQNTKYGFEFYSFLITKNVSSKIQWQHLRFGTCDFERWSWNETTPHSVFNCV